MLLKFVFDNNRAHHNRYALSITNDITIQNNLNLFKSYDSYSTVNFQKQRSEMRLKTSVEVPSSPGVNNRLH